MRSKLIYDRSLWPGSVDGIEAELADLWDSDRDSMSAFVAEALIGDRPVLVLKDSPDIVEALLWDMDTDCLSLEARISDLIADEAKALLCGSEGQAEECRDWLKDLARLQAAVESAEAHVVMLMANYESQEGR